MSAAAEIWRAASRTLDSQTALPEELGPISKETKSSEDGVDLILKREMYIIGQNLVREKLS